MLNIAQSNACKSRLGFSKAASQFLITRFLFSLLIASSLYAMLMRAGAGPSTVLFLILTFGAVVLLATGEAALILARVQAIPGRLPIAFVLGSVMTSLLIEAAVILGNFPPDAVFLLWGMVICLTTVGLCLRGQLTMDSREWLDLGAAVLAVVLVSFFCLKTAAALPTLARSGVLPAWSDYYIHGMEIAQFGDPNAVGRGDLLLVGQPLVFYHYGIYMLPATLMRITGLPGLALATSILLPLGLLLGAFGSFSLGKALSNQAGGILALTLVTLMPDAAHYGLKNGLFGFHWLLFAAPGSGYGIGTSAASLVLVERWLRSNERGGLILGLCLAAALLQVRAHFLLWFVPALLATVILSTSAEWRHRRSVIFGIGIVCVAAIILLTLTPTLRHLWLNFPDPIAFLQAAHHQDPMAYSGVYDRFVTQHTYAVSVLLGIILLVPAMLGIFTVIYPICMVSKLRHFRWESMDAFPIMLLATLVVVVVAAPVPPHGDSSEFRHRPFVLLYTVVVVWTSAYLVRLLAEKELFAAWSRCPAKSAKVNIVCIVALLGIAYCFRDIDPGRPRMSWAFAYYNLRNLPGLIEAATFIRGHSKAGDVLAVSNLDPQAMYLDPAIEIVSLTGVPAYLGQAGVQVTYGDERRTLVAERLARLQAIETATDIGAVFMLMRQYGIRWYVCVTSGTPRWDIERKRASFRAREAAVYDSHLQD